MSIINEALKRTQTLKQTLSAAAGNRVSQPKKIWPQTESILTAVHPASLPAELPAAPMAAPQHKKWHVIVILEILFLLFIVGVLFIVQPKFFSHRDPIGRLFPQMNFNAGSEQKIRPQQSPPAATPVPGAISTAAPLPTASHKFNHRPEVSGIVMNNNKITALIDGEIYEVGDYIDGKKITNITLNDVVLMDKNEVTVLSVRSNSR